MQQVGRMAAGGVARSGRAGPGREGQGKPGFTLGQPSAVTAAATAAVGAAGPVALGLLALQEGDAAAARDQAARRRAESILQELQGLQHDLLQGEAGMKRLERLAACETGELGADPLLRDAVQAVVLRARVELARRGWNAPVSNP